MRVVIEIVRHRWIRVSHRLTYMALVWLLRCVQEGRRIVGWFWVCMEVARQRTVPLPHLRLPRLMSHCMEDLGSPHCIKIISRIRSINGFPNHAIDVGGVIAGATSPNLSLMDSDLHNVRRQ